MVISPVNAGFPRHIKEARKNGETLARRGRRDRGLYSKIDSDGRVVWYVRLYDKGQNRRFGSFVNKTKAREFYEKAKLEQAEGRFFPGALSERRLCKTGRCDR